MFLNPTFFKKRLFKSIYKNIIKRLENKGIVVFNISNAVEELKRRHKNTIKYKSNILTFDDNYFPNVNTLYINLFAGQYYNDNIYNKKKVEKEREMLFLLAGKLGVKTITYNTEIVETTITKTNANLKGKLCGVSANFTKTINKTQGSEGKETYLNRGAPVYLKFDTLQEVEKNIEDKMHSNIFDYKFYKHSPKLENFVYKRYEFKMQKLEYKIETEDISDISFAVKAYFSYLIDYGIGISFDKNVIYNENVNYVLDFFTDDELKREFGKRKRDYIDKFYSIREYYDLIEDKDKAVHLITEYVMEYAKNYHYIIKDEYSSEPKIHNFFKHIQNFIKENNPGCFESICHYFQSTSQIRNWMDKEFLNDNMKIIDNINININKTKKEPINRDNISIILPFEKKKNLDLQSDLQSDLQLDLQSRLELIAKNNTDTDSSNLELNNIIKNCNVSNSQLTMDEDGYFIEKNFNNYMKSRSIKTLSPEIRQNIQHSENISNTELNMTDNNYMHYLAASIYDNDDIETKMIEEMENKKQLALDSFTFAIKKDESNETKNKAEIENERKLGLDSFQFIINKEEEEIAQVKEQKALLYKMEELRLEELKNRPPVIPLSRTESINSINSVFENDKDQPPYPPPPPPNSSDY